MKKKLDLNSYYKYKVKLRIKLKLKGIIGLVTQLNNKTYTFR